MLLLKLWGYQDNAGSRQTQNPANNFNYLSEGRELYMQYLQEE